MKKPRATTICIIALIGLCAVLLWRILWPSNLPPWAEHIAFSNKFFYDSAETTGDGWVEVTGSLAGQGIGYEDNATTISCDKARHECLVSSVEQIGPSQIGRLASPTSYSIVKWDKYEVVATNGSDDPNDCVKVTISLERRTKTALWVQEPINQSSISCKDSDTKIYKWTIDDPPFWKKLHAAQEAQH